MKIVKLEAQNVKRLTAVHITPEGSLVVVGGKNAAGKTSVLDSIAMAVGGKRLVPTEPLRKGAKKGHATVTLDNGLVVTRTFTKGGGGSLVVTGKDGAVKSPQSMLDRLTGALTFDPLEFSREPALGQLDTLRQLAGVDTAEYDDEEVALREKRRLVNSQVKSAKATLGALPALHEIKDPPINIAELADRIADGRDAATKLASAQKYCKTAEEELDTDAARVIELREQADGLEADIKKRRKTLDHEIKTTREMADDVPDLAALQKTLAGAEAYNEKVRENATRAGAEDELAQLEKNAFGLTSKIEQQQEQREAVIAAAKMPIEGLGLGEDGVLYNGVPFEQASSAEQLRVSVAMGLAMNPELKVLLIRDGSLLDENSMSIVAAMAEDAGAQVWMERVGEGAEVSVVIEDGTVREERTGPAPSRDSDGPADAVEMGQEAGDQPNLDKTTA